MESIYLRAQKKIKKYLTVQIKLFLQKHAMHYIDDILVEEIKNNVKIISAEETFQTIENFIDNNRKGVYMRFGDGDTFLSQNIDDGFQKSTSELTIEMREAFSLQGNNVIKCLRIHSDLFGFSEGMKPNNHKNKDKFALQLFKDSYKYFVGSNIYSPVAMHYMANQNPTIANAFLKKLKAKTKIFIGNQEVKKDTLSLLFGEDVIHVKTPIENAYTEIDRIENEAIDVLKNIDEFHIIVIAMGCSGRPLMKRLWKLNPNAFLFDFGSILDGIEGNETRTWLKSNHINYALLLKDL